MMREEWPLVVNDRSNCDKAYADSISYLRGHPEVRSQLKRFMWAYHEAADLIPQTLDKVMSGHFFPYAQSYEELENAYQLALGGFYRYALIALRNTLELGVIGVFFAVEDQEHVETQPWLRGEEYTPSFQLALRRLGRLDRYNRFDARFGITPRLRALYDELGAFAHLRGYRRSPHALGIPNFNAWSEKAMNLFVGTLCEVVAQTLTTMLLKYPFGMCPLPLDQKYGFNGPVGGFVQAHQVELFRSVVPDEEAAFIQSLTDSDPDVQSVVMAMNALPDVSDDELAEQAKEFEERDKAQGPSKQD